MNKGWLWAVGGFVIAFVATAGVAYGMGSSDYKQAMSALNVHQWSSAKTHFAAARARGVVFFQGGPIAYHTAVNEYADKQYEAAEQASQSGNFKGMEKAAAAVPQGSNAYAKAAVLLKQDPTKAVLTNLIPPAVTIQTRVPFMFASGTPAIAVTGQRMIGGYPAYGEFYLLVWDTTSNAYNVKLSREQKWGAYAASVGHLFGNTSNALVVQDNNGGSGGDIDVKVYGLSASGQLVEHLDTGWKWEGYTYIEGEKLHVLSGSNQTVYRWDGNQFLSRAVFTQTAGPNDAVVHYWLNQNGSATVADTSVTMHVGQRLDFIREDHNTSQNDRLMQMSGNNVITFGGNPRKPYAIVAKRPGHAQITIVPNGGYDWSKAMNININITVGK